MTLDDLRKIDLQDLRNIDLRSAGDWPPVGKAVALALLAVVIVWAGYYFVISKTLDDLASRRQDEQQLRQQFVVKYRQAVNLDAYREQLAQLRESFEAMRRQLPDSNEIASLLVEITQAGLGRGLEFELFQPSDPKPSGFYAEIPINIEVSGTYHQLGEFVSDVAAFPRIVTLHNLSMTPVGADSDLLIMRGMAKTYQYQEEDEL
ncbi:MAG TPA: pilus assembly protein PilO [Gammaproteobacteria bacterium]|uniref:type 4a pilus biogenesis protein PilO n=1 Tax=Immundisolibacter sp. TaxID=1934948 RepID=UPI000E903F4C|nr:pilus assembly protein PilO [Gammaproteobacteria bacterium]HCO44346.1 pilus assembly protein PilO [Gammaproteobacteria bacterium]HCZ49138.1 pilus assembly protein PilO [Gammaproteobacteria bacterium]MCH78576.1 pilus assembly protein PilO [Gammaproteobacteria bacterium]